MKKGLDMLAMFEQKQLIAASREAMEHSCYRRQKLHFEGYNSNVERIPYNSTFIRNSDYEPYISCNREGAQGHACIDMKLKPRASLTNWHTWLMSERLNSISAAQQKIHARAVTVGANGQKEPTKLLYQLVKKVSNKDYEFSYPRDLTFRRTDGLILIADSAHHQIVSVNSFCLPKGLFGGADDLNTPMSVSVDGVDQVVTVADFGNSRLRSFDLANGVFSRPLSLADRPTCVRHDYTQLNLQVCCLQRGELILASASGDQVFNRLTTLSGVDKPRSQPGVYLCALHKGRIYVVRDGQSEVVELDLRNWQKPLASWEALGENGISLRLGGLCVDGVGDKLLISDSLNHTVTEHALNGALTRCVLRPIHDLGPVHSVGLSPEGHIVALEFAANRPHGIKVFRGRECLCHQISTAAN